MNIPLKPYEQILIVVAIILFVLSFFIPDKYNLYDYLKAKRLESYNQKHKEIFITCIYCNGTGETEEDVNLIMRDAKMALWLNYHLMSEKCTDCDSKNNQYCVKVDRQYEVFLKEYETIGPKMELTSCRECMGMGSFSCMKKDGSYMTQQEYEERERRKNDK